MTIVQALFSAKGRMRRRDYWLYSIASGVATLALYYVGYLLLSDEASPGFLEEFDKVYSLEPTPVSLFYTIVMVAAQWPAICIMAKRWHDRGRSGWLAGGFMVVSWGLSFAQLYVAGTESYLVPIVLGLLNLAFSIWIFIELGCLDGTKGRNKYGPSPKGIGDEAEVF